MKIVTWNCNLQLSKKADVIKLFDADVFVFQECERLPIDYFPGYQFFWTGQNNKKGLAVVVLGNNSFTVEDFKNNLAYFLPVQTEKDSCATTLF